MAVSNTNIGDIGLTVRMQDRTESMLSYDDLPPSIRLRIASSTIPIAAISALELIEKYGPQLGQQRAMIAISVFERQAANRLAAVYEEGAKKR